MTIETSRDAFRVRNAALAKVKVAREAEATARGIFNTAVKARCDLEMELTTAEMALAAELEKDA